MSKEKKSRLDDEFEGDGALGAVGGRTHQEPVNDLIYPYNKNGDRLFEFKSSPGSREEVSLGLEPDKRCSRTIYPRRLTKQVKRSASNVSESGNAAKKNNSGESIVYYDGDGFASTPTGSSPPEVSTYRPKEINKKNIRKISPESPPNKRVMLQNLDLSSHSSPDKKESSAVDSSEIILDSTMDERGSSSYRYLCEDVMEYAVDVFLWKKNLESKYRVPDSLSNQSDISPTMRRVVLNWLVTVNRQFNFTLETWCLTVNILDQFLKRKPMKVEVLQLAGLTSFFIAAKQEEVYPPDISELVNVCANTNDRSKTDCYILNSKHFKDMELMILNYIQFDLNAPTPAYFLTHLVEIEQLSNVWPEWLSRHVIERILCDYELSQKSPSSLATAIFNLFSSKLLKESRDPRLLPNPPDTSYETHFDLINEYFNLTVSNLEKM